MPKSTEHLFAQRVSRLRPYTPITPPWEVARQMGIAAEEIIKIDANENPFGTLQEGAFGTLQEGLLQQLRPERWHIYPDPNQTAIRALIAKYTGFPPQCIVAGCGADEILDLLLRVYLNPGDAVLHFPPSFSYYAHLVALNDGQLHACQRRPADLRLCQQDLEAVDFTGIKMALLSSPNNPSGDLASPEVLEYLLAQDILLVLDEAYFEFASQSHAHLLESHHNIVVVRTFSKAFALAGLRIGYALASPECTEAIMRIKPPYSLSMIAEDVLEYNLKHLDLVQQRIAEIKSTREYLFGALAAHQALSPLPSEANYILTRLARHNAGELQAALRSEGFLVRRFEGCGEESLRFSVGTKAQMERLIATLHRLLSMDHL